MMHEPQNDPPRRLELNGEYDLSQKEEIAALFGGLRADGPATIDLTKVTYVDSSFLNELVALRLRFREQPITLAGANANIARILRMAKFEKLFNLAD